MRARVDIVVAGPSGHQVVDREADVAGRSRKLRGMKLYAWSRQLFAGMGHRGNDETGLGERERGM